VLVVLVLVAAVMFTVLGAYRPSPGGTAAILAALACVAGARAIVGSALGLEVCARRQVFAMRMRAAATQFGYLLGAVLGGLALATWGYPGMGATFGALFGLAAIPHGVALIAQRRPQPTVTGGTPDHPAASSDIGS
jgi:predicted MFS family arabinose efflux permease